MNYEHTYLCRTCKDTGYTSTCRHVRDGNDTAWFARPCVSCSRGAECGEGWYKHKNKKATPMPGGFRQIGGAS